VRISYRHLAIIALIISNIIWGAASPIFKWSLESIQPFTLAFLRFFIASLILWIFALPNMTLKIKDIPKIILLAAFGIFGNISLFFFGLRLTSSINAPVIAASAPVFLILIAYFYFHDKPTKKVVLGTMVSLIGTIIIIINPLLGQNQDGSIFGNLLLLLATMCFVVYTTLLKKFDLQYQPLTLIFWIFFVSSIMFFPFFANEVRNTNFLQSLNTQAIIGILYGALSSSTLAYLCYDIGVKYLKASEIGIFSYIDPIITILIAIPLLGETITNLYVIGTLTVFAGIIIAERRLHTHSIHPNHLSKKDD